MEFLQVTGPILSTSLKLAVSLTESKYQLLQGMDGDGYIRKLSSHLTIIQYVAQDAEERQLDDLHIRDWLRKIKEAACDAEDILKSLETEACLWQQRKQQTSNNFKSPISKSQIAFKLKGADELKDVLARLDEIADEKKFHLTVNLNVKRDTYGGRHTAPFVIETDVFGREDDRDKKIEILLSDKEDDIAAVSVMGMGGLGKTTLAQLYTDRVKDHKYKHRHK